MNTPAGLDGQMSEALRNMAAHRAASHAVDRRGWTSQQWADDAKRLMSDLDGSVSSLLNGHVMGLIAERDHLHAVLDTVRTLADEFEQDRTVIEGHSMRPVYSSGVVADRIRLALAGLELDESGSWEER